MKAKTVYMQLREELKSALSKSQGLGVLYRATYEVTAKEITQEQIDKLFALADQCEIRRRELI